MRRITLAALSALLVAGCGSTVHSRHQDPQFGRTTPQALLHGRLTYSHAPTVEMIDAIYVSDIGPLHPRVLAGYTSGHWPSFWSMLRAFPHTPVKSIAIAASPTSAHKAFCLDVEPGDASPSQAPGWWRFARASGWKRPCIYSSLSVWYDSLFGIMRSAGIPRSAYFAWDAHYTFRPGIEAGFDGTQWTDRAHGRNLDESTVTLDFAGIRSKPTVKPHLHCFGPHAHLRNRTCQQVRHQVAGWKWARDSSQRAFHARHCDLLAQRDRWLSEQIRRHPHSKLTPRRQKALHTTRRVERQRGCASFSGRVAFYDRKITQAHRRY